MDRDTKTNPLTHQIKKYKLKLDGFADFSYVYLYPDATHEIRRQRNVLKNLQNDEFIQIWREILIGLLVSDDVIAIRQEIF